MKKFLKTILKKNRRFHELLKTVRFLTDTKLQAITGTKKKYPKVIQLPITYNCNSRCVMCNIWKMDHSNEASLSEFSKFMSDDLFKKVVSVGINGGEPSLVRDLWKYAEEIVKLPSIQSLNIISHGFSRKPLLSNLEKIYEVCKRAKVNFHVSISLDGYMLIHDTVRGRATTFEKTAGTIEEISTNQSKYCDSFDLGCTVVNQNVDHLVELDEFVKRHNYPIRYRLGIENKRIESDKLTDQFSVLYNPLVQSAAEFFHGRIWQVSSIAEKFKYFAIYHWLTNKKKQRLLGCTWKDEGVTLDARGAVYYCAVASDKLGSLREDKGKDIFFNKKNITYRKELVETSCNNCIHDYSGKPEIKHVWLFLRYMLKNKLVFKFYALKGRWFI